MTAGKKVNQIVMVNTYDPNALFSGGQARVTKGKFYYKDPQEDPIFPQRKIEYICKNMGHYNENPYFYFEESLKKSQRIVPYYTFSNREWVSSFEAGGCLEHLLQNLSHLNLTNKLQKKHFFARMALMMYLPLKQMYDSGKYFYDFKLDNIVLRDNGWLGLIDYDLQKTNQVGKVELEGTPGYIPPEVLAAAPLYKPEYFQKLQEAIEAVAPTRKERHRRCPVVTAQTHYKAWVAWSLGRALLVGYAHFNGISYNDREDPLVFDTEACMSNMTSQVKVNEAYKNLHEYDIEQDPLYKNIEDNNLKALVKGLMHPNALKRKQFFEKKVLNQQYFKSKNINPQSLKENGLGIFDKGELKIPNTPEELLTALNGVKNLKKKYLDPFSNQKYILHEYASVKDSEQFHFTLVKDSYYAHVRNRIRRYQQALRLRLWELSDQFNRSDYQKYRVNYYRAKLSKLQSAIKSDQENDNKELFHEKVSGLETLIPSISEWMTMSGNRIDFSSELSAYHDALGEGKGQKELLQLEQTVKTTYSGKGRQRLLTLINAEKKNIPACNRYTTFKSQEFVLNLGTQAFSPAFKLPSKTVDTTINMKKSVARTVMLLDPQQWRCFSHALWFKFLFIRVEHSRQDICEIDCCLKQFWKQDETGERVKTAKKLLAACKKFLTENPNNRRYFPVKKLAQRTAAYLLAQKSVGKKVKNKKKIQINLLQARKNSLNTRIKELNKVLKTADTALGETPEGMAVSRYFQNNIAEKAQYMQRDMLKRKLFKVKADLRKLGVNETEIDNSSMRSSNNFEEQMSSSQTTSSITITN